MAVKPRKPVLRTKGTGPTERRGGGKGNSGATKVDGNRDVRIFMSYSHQDAAAQARLDTHLAPWRRAGVTVWYDGNIDPGADLDTEIARKLREADIFVALFSPAYLASRYCWEVEYKRAMGRRARKLMRVVAVVVKPCAWKETRAAGFKLLPKDGLPPERWSSSDAAYLDAAQGIGTVIKAVRRELAGRPTPGPRTRGKSASGSKPDSKPSPGTGKPGKVTPKKPTTRPAARSRKAASKA